MSHPWFDLHYLKEKKLMFVGLRQSNNADNKQVIWPHKEEAIVTPSVGRGL